MGVVMKQAAIEGPGDPPLVQRLYAASQQSSCYLGGSQKQLRVEPDQGITLGTS